MSETSDNATRGPGQAECLGGTLGKMVDEVMAAVGPSENVAKHFREARVHLLMGFRQMIDERIDYLNRSSSKGARVVVE